MHERLTPMKTLGLTLLAALVVWGAAPVTQAATEYAVERGVAMKTRDGVILRADVYRPTGEGDFPVLLTRTPYDKAAAAPFARKAAARGFLVVVQDVRGRYGSEGNWYPLKFEKLDGYDAVEWAAALPHSNGKVGMFGGSYPGAAQMLAATAHPPHLVGLCPIVTPSNFHENWVYHGGALEQWFAQSWTTLVAKESFSRLIRQSSPDPLPGTHTLPLTHFPLLSGVPTPGSPGFTGRLAPFYLDWLAHPAYDKFWQQWSLEDQYEQIKVPALHITAWYDSSLGGSLRNYTGLKLRAGLDSARKGQRLVVALGGHAGQGRQIGEVDFGPAADEYDEDELVLGWYDYLLKGDKNSFATAKPVRLFVMGDNQWRDEAAWPIERARLTRLFLHSSGKANTAAGNGSLSPTAPEAETRDKFLYDPANPVPTTGGPLCCDNEHLMPGPRDQRPVEDRPDVLVYTSPVLNEELEVTGPVKLDLYAASSAADTDFTAKLVDVAPDGSARNVTEGIVRARFRESTTAAKPLIPGRAYKFQIDLWATSNLFRRGHRIRLEISSSNYPRFDRNLNTGKDQTTSSTHLRATNSILHDTAHPSALLLPVVPRAGQPTQ